VCHSDWQDVDELRQFCHSWQDAYGGRLTAMMTFAILLLVAIVAARGAVAVWHWIDNDGGPAPEPPRPLGDEWSPDLPTHSYNT
jgi:hypothetical protein